MALDTFESLWRSVVLRCPLAGPFLAQDWIKHTFREIAERRQWSWLVKFNQLLVFNAVSAGTVTTTFNSQSVVGDATAAAAWDATLIGRQFRIGRTTPIYTITAVTTTTNPNDTLTLEIPYGGTSGAGLTYSIYNAYFTMPSDFHAFISVWDPAFNWQLWTTILQEELNSWDAQRAQQGTAWVLSAVGYDTTVTPPLPRYELWPGQLSQKPYPMLYESRLQDLGDSGASLPRFIRGDVLLEGALWKAAMWPGPSRERPNPYFNLGLAAQHQGHFMSMVYDLERQDDEVRSTDVRYQQWIGLPFAPLPVGDASWLQAHAI